MGRFLFRICRWLRAEIVLGFLVATVFWISILGWQSAYAPTDAEKQKCYDAAERTGYKTEECKSLWERATSDPVAFFTFWLVISTVGLGLSTVMLWRAGERQFRHARRFAIIQSRQMQASVEAADRNARAAERALTDLDRPWIFVIQPTIVRIGDDWIVQYIVANYGRMPAIIERANIGVETSPGEPPLPLTVFDDHNLAISPIIAAGEQRHLREPLALPTDGSISFRVLPDCSVGEQIPTFILPGGEDAFFRAVIRYRGPQTRGHETAAAWLYQHSIEFVLRGGEELNYNH